MAEEVGEGELLTSDTQFYPRLMKVCLTDREIINIAEELTEVLIPRLQSGKQDEKETVVKRLRGLANLIEENIAFSEDGLIEDMMNE
jgi:hypothetical protein